MRKPGRNTLLEALKVCLKTTCTGENSNITHKKGDYKSNFEKVLIHQIISPQCIRVFKEGYSTTSVLQSIAKIENYRIETFNECLFWTYCKTTEIVLSS